MNKIVVVLVTLACVYLSNGAKAENFIAVSWTGYKMIVQTPPVQFLVNVENKCIEKSYTYPFHGNMRMLDINPVKRSVAVWGYAKENKGFLLLVPVDKPDTCRTYEIPFSPIFGGYFINNSGSSATTVTRDLTEKKPSQGEDYVFEANYNSEGIMKTLATVDYSKVICQGSPFIWGESRANAMPVGIDPDTDKNMEKNRGYWYPLNLHLPEDIIKKYREISESGKQVYSVAIVVNREDLTLLSIIIKAPELKDYKCFHLANGTELKSWKWFDLKRRGDVYPSMQLFGHWLNVQTMLGKTSETKEGTINVPAIMHDFYDMKLEKRGEWKSPPNTELLLITETMAYFRCEDKLLKAKFDNGKVGELEVICSSPQIWDVHWAITEK